MDPKGHHLNLRGEPRLVEVSIGGEVVASSTRVVVLEETGLPPRHYFPRDDVRMDRLTRTETETVCPFKGRASYFALDVDGTTHRDLVWTYERPIDGMERIKDLVCFFEERVDLNIGGESRERPVTAWSDPE
jgi:uncharacterized protein (DUF427 family)